MTHRKVLDIEELKKVFRIVDGKLERLDRRMSAPTWRVVESKANQSRGYCLVCFNGKTILYHTLLWNLQYNENIQKGLCIDHINGNRIDNRLDNLRLVTQRENCQNMTTHRKGQLVGAFYFKKEKLYQARITINNKKIHLGYYKTAEEGHKAYEIACQHIEEYVDSESFRAIIKNKLCS